MASITWLSSKSSEPSIDGTNPTSIPSRITWASSPAVPSESQIASRPSRRLTRTPNWYTPSLAVRASMPRSRKASTTRRARFSSMTVQLTDRYPDRSGKIASRDRGIRCTAGTAAAAPPPSGGVAAGRRHISDGRIGRTRARGRAATGPSASACRTRANQARGRQTGSCQARRREASRAQRPDRTRPARARRRGFLAARPGPRHARPRREPAHRGRPGPGRGRDRARAPALEAAEERVLDAAGLLVLGELADAALVTWILRERRREERLGQAERLVHWMVARADAHDVGVVVLAGQPCGVLAPHEGGAHALDLVRRDLLAVAGATDHDAQASRILDRAGRCGEARRRVVVVQVERERTAVDRLVAETGQVLDECSLELESRVVAAEVDAHAGIIAVARRSRRPASVEARGLRAGALDLEEVGVPGDQPGAVPNPQNVLATRDAGEHGAEERRAVDVDDRRTDLVAHRIHALVMRLAQRLVVLGRVGGVGE